MKSMNFRRKHNNHQVIRREKKFSLFMKFSLTGKSSSFSSPTVTYLDERRIGKVLTTLSLEGDIVESRRIIVWCESF